MSETILLEFIKYYTAKTVLNTKQFSDEGAVISERYWKETLGPVMNTLMRLNKTYYALLNIRVARFWIRLETDLYLKLPAVWCFYGLTEIQSWTAYETRDCQNRPRRQWVAQNGSDAPFGENRYSYRLIDGKLKYSMETRLTEWCRKHCQFRKMKTNDFNRSDPYPLNPIVVHSCGDDHVSSLLKKRKRNDDE